MHLPLSADCIEKSGFSLLVPSHGNPTNKRQWQASSSEDWSPKIKVTQDPRSYFLLCLLIATEEKITILGTIPSPALLPCHKPRNNESDHPQLPRWMISQPAPHVLRCPQQQQETTQHIKGYIIMTKAGSGTRFRAEFNAIRLMCPNSLAFLRIM